MLFRSNLRILRQTDILEMFLAVDMPLIVKQARQKLNLMERQLVTEHSLLQQVIL